MYSDKVKFGIAIPQAFGGKPVDTALIQRFLKKVDSVGYHSVWVQDVIDASLLEPGSLLGYAAACTERVRLGSAVFLSVLRPPLQLAKSLATLDQLSAGRVIFGAALGSNTQIYPAYGISAEKRVSRFVESITLIKKLWTQERVAHNSGFWQLRDQSLEPKPVQKPHPPIWLGGSHPNAIRRAILLANGWIGGRTSIGKFKVHVSVVKQTLQELGRDPEEFMIGKRVYIALTSNKAQAEAELNKWFNEVYGVGEIASSAAIYGSEQECVDKIGEFVHAGAKLLILNPVSHHMEHLERLASEVIPKI